MKITLLIGFMILLSLLLVSSASAENISIVDESLD